MAKKTQMNFFESHVEKLVILVVVGVLGWVVWAHLIQPGKVKLSDEAAEAKETAQQIERDLDNPKALPDGTITYVPQAPYFGQVELLPEQLVDALALSPPVGTGVQKEDRLYAMPEVPELKTPLLTLTQTIALTEAEDDDEDAGILAGDYVPTDVDFVTLEAEFPLAEFREAFAQSFTDESLEFPMENAQPVLAVVELQRSALLADGGWGEFEMVPRVAIGDDPALPALTAADIVGRSQALYEVTVVDYAERPDLQVQLAQPMPYEFERANAWMSPSERIEEEKLRKEEEAERRRREAAGRGGGGRGGAMGGGGMMGGPGGARGRGRGARGGAGGPMGGGGPGMGMMGGDMMMGGPGMMGGGGRTERRERRTPQRRERRGSFFEEDSVKVWAHDGALAPGVVYRYRLRVGFFNPVGGKGWTDVAVEVDDDHLIYSDWVSTEDVVKTDARLAFFPNPGSTDGTRASFDVYRKLQGQIFKKTFVLNPGQAIGKEVRMSLPGAKVRRGGDDEPQTIMVDFRTNATVLATIPNTVHWSKPGAQLVKKQTTDVVMQDTNGEIVRIGADPTCWPLEMAQAATRWKRSLREQDRLIREQQQGGRDTRGGVRGGVRGGRRR